MVMADTNEFHPSVDGLKTCTAAPIGLHLYVYLHCRPLYGHLVIINVRKLWANFQFHTDGSTI